MTLGDMQPKGIAIDAYAADAGEHLDRCRAAGRLPDHACDPRPSHQMLGAVAPFDVWGNIEPSGVGGAVQLLGARRGRRA